MKLAADPFAGSGPREWSTPFQTIDAFQAIPDCKEALRRHPDDARLKLATAFSYIAGRKNDQAKPLLNQLVAAKSSDAMLALAFISKGAEATELMRKAGEGGNASGLMLYGMAQLFGQGVPKDEAGGLSSLRRAAEAGHPCHARPRQFLLQGRLWRRLQSRRGEAPAHASRRSRRSERQGGPCQS